MEQEKVTSAPMPPVAAASPLPQPTTQTGVAGQPILVENVQYKAPQSRIGLAFSIYTLAMFIGTLLIGGFLALLLDSSLGGVGFDDEVKIALISLISGGVPTAIAFWLSRLRVSALLTENPANYEEVSFKKSLRMWFMIAVLLFAWRVGFGLFTILTTIFVPTVGYSNYLTAGDNATLILVINVLLGVVLAGAFLWTLWGYQKQTKR